MKLLFMSVGNSARGPMAEGLARKILGHDVDVRSAGTKPKRALHPLALRELQAAGVSTEKLKVKGLDRIEFGFLGDVDFVIVLSEEKVAPRLPGDFTILEWIIPDLADLPEAMQANAFASARAFLEKKLGLFRTALMRAQQAEDLEL